MSFWTQIDGYAYRFLLIRSDVIDARAYTSDVIIYNDRVDATWWRKEGHRLHPEDIVDALNVRLESLIIGTGYSGVMTVPEKTREYIAARGVDVIVERTGKAVEIFNALQSQNRHVVAALHLTC
jgi:hypothetical protein